jgi:hypothetical protein
MPVSDNDEVSAEDVTELFLSLESLEYLELDFDKGNSDSEWQRFRAIARVVDHPTVTDLNLQLPFDANHDAIIHNLSSLLVSTNILTSLSIYYVFNESTAASFVDALQQNRTLTVLTFNDCIFDDTDETIPIVIEFFQAMNVNSIRALSFHYINPHDKNCFTGRQLSKLVNGPGGGGIETLDLVEYHYCWTSGFWCGLEANVQSRTLQSIKLPQ